MEVKNSREAKGASGMMLKTVANAKGWSGKIRSKKSHKSENVERV